MSSFMKTSSGRFYTNPVNNLSINHPYLSFTTTNTPIHKLRPGNSKEKPNKDTTDLKTFK